MERFTTLTLGPAGPSLTAQTAVPQTKQLVQRQVCLSLTSVSQPWKVQRNYCKGTTNQSLREPPPPQYPAPAPVSGVPLTPGVPLLPSGLRLRKRRFFLLLSPRPIGVSLLSG